MANGKQWPWVAGLATSGMIDSIYLLLYQIGRIRRLVCPVFGPGCEQVTSSPVAYPGGVPDAVFGVVGYAAAAATALAIPRTSGRMQRILAAGAVGGSVAAVGISAYLTYAQPTRTGSWCFWCLTSAAISAVMAPLTISGAKEVLCKKQDQRKYIPPSVPP